jgi:hypothetical protein
MLLRELTNNTNRPAGGATAILGWGRGMGHKGHMLLAQAVIHYAHKFKAEPYFVVSRTSVVDPSTGDVWADRAKLNRTKEDPLTPNEKLAIYKKVFPDQSHIFSVATEDATKLEQVMAKLVQQGFTNIVLVVGEDQKNALGFLQKADKSGTSPAQQMGLASLKIISRQDTKAPGSDVSKPDYQAGPRATPMRQILLDPAKSEQDQFAVWRRDMPDNLSDEEVMHLMQTAKARLIKAHTPAVRGKKAVAEAGKGISKDAETKFHTKLDRLVHDTFGRRKSEKSSAEGIKGANQVARELRNTNSMHEGIRGQSDTLPAVEKQSGPYAKRYDNMDTYYDMYRLGIAIAGGANTPAQGPTRANPTLWINNEVDNEKIKAAEKIMGIKGTVVVPKGTSQELSDTNAVSAVAKPKRNKYGI